MIINNLPPNSICHHRMQPLVIWQGQIPALTDSVTVASSPLDLYMVWYCLCAVAYFYLAVKLGEVFEEINLLDLKVVDFQLLTCTHNILI